MDVIIAFVVGGGLGVGLMAILSSFKKDEDYSAGFTQGYKKGVTELKPDVRELELREACEALEQ